MRYLIALLLLAVVPSVWAGQNTLLWDDMSDNETTFHIQRKDALCPAAGAFIEIGTVGANVTSYTDSGLTEGQGYCYQVRASNPQGVSGPSNTAGRLVPFTVPNAPSNLRFQ